MATTVETRFQEKIRKKKGAKTLRDVLKVLDLPYDMESELTLGGRLLAVQSGLAPQMSDQIIWVNPELDVLSGAGAGSATVKTDRMWPFAVHYADVQAVENFHQPLFSNWEEFVSQQQMLTPSEIMNEMGCNHDWAIQYYLFLVGPQIHFKLAEFRTWQWYVDSALALVYPRDHRMQYVLEWKDAKGVHVETLHDNYRNFIGWLDTYYPPLGGSHRKVDLYVGIEYPPAEGYPNKTYPATHSRLWAAFSDKVNQPTILAVRSFADMLHRRYLRSLYDTLALP